VQGLADLYMMLGLPYESPGATELNKQIFETLYFAACDASCALAEQEGVYASYAGSPTSQGRLQFDLWGVTPPAGRHDWAGLKARIAAHGLRNSLLVAPMPTATTSHILGWNEGTAPILSNVFSRKVLAGDFIVINKHLVLALEKLGLWSEEMKQRIVAADGSVQGIDVIPLALREVYKTVWEISQRVIIDAAADRGPYIDQSQSMNLYPAQLTLASISSMHFHTWRRGLKTGMYYMHVQPTARAAAVTVEATAIGAPAAEAPVVCDRTNRDCAACSS
jgi:ribonucleotide reductase alpha subunit